MRYRFISALIVFFLYLGYGSAQSDVENLKVNHEYTSLDLDIEEPRFEDDVKHSKKNLFALLAFPCH
ncbi:hypothetical protein [Pseudozobellia sp. WGM2]|uniref:hypothetical protein n=1 Tax=Pseudozobellia sp. WGM2 TaxID=2787625 RepID=UPI001ADFBE4F|nr:hypothetical protein [Pseudozobellia sp. WGM2]